LQQNRDFGEADCDVVDDDGAVEGLLRVNVTILRRSRFAEIHLHVRNVLLLGHRPCVAAKPVSGFCFQSAIEIFWEEPSRYVSYRDRSPRLRQR
jgi:hypothetical protein